MLKIDRELKLTTLEEQYNDEVNSQNIDHALNLLLKDCKQIL